MLRAAIIGTMALTACAAAPADEGLMPVSSMTCTVSGSAPGSLDEGAVCGAFREVFSETLSERWPGLAVAVEIRTPYQARVALSDAAGRSIIERELSISDSSLNRRAFESMAKSIAAELSAGD